MSNPHKLNCQKINDLLRHSTQNSPNPIPKATTAARAKTHLRTIYPHTYRDDDIFFLITALQRRGLALVSYEVKVNKRSRPFK